MYLISSVLRNENKHIYMKKYSHNNDDTDDEMFPEWEKFKYNEQQMQDVRQRLNIIRIYKNTGVKN